MKRTILFFVFSICLGVTAAALASEDDDHGHEDAEHREGRAHIAPEMAQKAGITTAIAGSGTLAKTTTVYGRLATLPGNVSHIRARFPGLVTEVRANIGDSVKAGDVLAVVESNESLKVYQLRSPIAGVVTERRANTGESTLDNVLFTVADLAVLWADLKIFPNQRSQIAPGDAAVLSADDLSQEAILDHVVPSSTGQPFVIARAEVNNSDGRWTPGLLVKGSIRTETVDVPLAIPNRALQAMEGETVVFVVEGDEFVARPIKTGRSDGRRTEILSGLEAGDAYVVDNSYLIKADLEKSSAEDSD